MNVLNMLASNAFWTAWYGWIQYILLAVMFVCAIFIILVVMFQPGNSSGVSALGGQSETFLTKNKSKTFEHKMKVLTVISGIVFGVLCIVFMVIASLA